MGKTYERSLILDLFRDSNSGLPPAHPDLYLTTEDLENYLENALQPLLDVLSRHPNIPPSWARKAIHDHVTGAQHQNLKVITNISQNIGVPPESLAELVEGETRLLKEIAPRNPNLPSEGLGILISYLEEFVNREDWTEALRCQHVPPLICNHPSLTAGLAQRLVLVMVEMAFAPAPDTGFGTEITAGMRHAHAAYPILIREMEADPERADWVTSEAKSRMLVAIASL